MSAEEFTGLGFAPGVVRGVRSFEVDKLGRLTGVIYRKVWTPQENVAVCLRDESDMASLYRVMARLSSQASSSSRYFQGPLGVGAIDPLSAAAPAPKLVKPPHEYASCGCGFYGYFDGSDDYHGNGRITAVVEGYGETVIGTRGFRAMKARIVALKVATAEVSYPLEQKVRRNYAEVPFFDSFEELVAAFPPDHSLAPSPETDDTFWTRDA